MIGMDINTYIQQNIYWLIPVLFIDFILKGYALWRAGRNNQLYWFIALLVVNSIGILPLIFILFFQRKKSK